MPQSARIPAARGRRLHIVFDAEPIVCYEGETIATALLAAGVTAFRSTRDGDARHPLCNMGTCFECVVTVDGVPMVRACLTPVAVEMTVESTRDV